MFMVVRGAAAGYWENVFDKDPNEEGLPLAYAEKREDTKSLRNTYDYSEFDLCHSRTKELNELYPNQGYSVVKVLYKEPTRVKNEK